MTNKNSLLIGRGIFTIIIIVAFGIIILNEKGMDLFKNKADRKINNYLETYYSESLPNLIQEETKIDNKLYIKKIKSKQNSNHYFYIKYDKTNIFDTYKEDYEEGKSLLNYLTKKIENDILNKTNITCKVLPTTSLNEYSDPVKEKLLQEDNLLELKFYYIKSELLIEKWNKNEITNQIKSIITTMKSNNISPKYYEITITNKNEITTAIKISNITDEFLDNNDAEKIIEDILNNKDIKNSKIAYQYQN